MIKLERRLIGKFRMGTDEKWLPHGISPDTFYQVIAIKTEKRINKNKKEYEDLQLGVINSIGELVFIAHFNMELTVEDNK